MTQAQAQKFEELGQATDEALSPLTVEFCHRDGLELQKTAVSGAGGHSSDLLATGVEGTKVNASTAHFTVPKTRLSDLGLPEPKRGDVVVIAGIDYTIDRIFGQGDNDPNWSLRMIRDALR